MLGFAVIASHASPGTVGTLNAVYNILTFAAALIIQVLFGVLADIFVLEGNHDPSTAYRMSLLAILSGQAVLLLYAGRRFCRRHCRSGAA